MVIVQVPFRISFFGGGTDFPAFYEKFGGFVISTSIDKYCYVTVRDLPPFFDYKNYISYSCCERTERVDDIKHPLVREAMRFLNLHDLTVLYDADLPARTGLGTSSSFAVALLLAFYTLKGKYVGKKKLADDAMYLERVLCRESGGVQDQIAVSFGGLNGISLGPGGYVVHPIPISAELKNSLNDNLLLFFTGISRISGNIQKEYEKSIGEKSGQLLSMKDIAFQSEEALTNYRIDDFGMLLNETWKLKRKLSDRVSNNIIDVYYQKAISAGALGGKLLGAGGGGFLLIYARKEKQESVRAALSTLREIPFRFEDGGARVLYYACS